MLLLLYVVMLELAHTDYYMFKLPAGLCTVFTMAFFLSSIPAMPLSTARSQTSDIASNLLLVSSMSLLSHTVVLEIACAVHDIQAACRICIACTVILLSSIAAMSLSSAPSQSQMLPNNF